VQPFSGSISGPYGEGGVELPRVDGDLSAGLMARTCFVVGVLNVVRYVVLLALCSPQS